ncbi:hypothetical protein QJS10_CPB15g01172 [Acorus calamus]|uniref:Uncharacterized protein n=1 Tax=Acorus calamus TaxID=4465 RepID=A0AAV9D829_ACOCL|nr:hypothetical protein QJS10_CPB15g01172 [Acorus calamus]
MARRLLSKCNDKKLEECLEKMMALENRVRSCYSEPIEMGSSEFAEMMFLDGCFILGVLLREKPDVEKMLQRPLHDEAMARGELLKLQSSLKRAMDANFEGNDELKMLRAMMEAKQANWVWAAPEGEEEPERGEIHNLLYALELVDHDLLKIENQIPFFVVEALFDLLLPPEGTLLLLSNATRTRDHITYYASFMESMIKTPGDVKALQSEGIMRIGKSNEVEVARLFNELCNEVFVNNSMSYLRELLYKVNEHCGSKWNKWRAVLARNYFNNPWSIISLVAAMLVIVLTFLQTYTSLYSYAHHEL